MDLGCKGTLQEERTYCTPVHPLGVRSVRRNVYARCIYVLQKESSIIYSMICAIAFVHLRYKLLFGNESSLQNPGRRGPAVAN